MPDLPANESYEEEILLSNTVSTSFAVCPVSPASPANRSATANRSVSDPAWLCSWTTTMCPRRLWSQRSRLWRPETRQVGGFWVIALLGGCTAGRLSMPGRCRHLRVLPSCEGGEAQESEASRRICLHYSCQFGRHWQCPRRTLLADTVALVGAGGENQGG